MKQSLSLNFILILTIFLTACASPNDKRLEQALQFAGDNRGELEKVLAHYANDSLKKPNLYAGNSLRFHERFLYQESVLNLHVVFLMLN